ncbi:hypothetical protein IscW_ISCW004971 [Ixodes scapularis]|uniref:Uncharacterized protein n=1 Tax=Ixodes scapularis TaxID=6945 RepID=B7PET4_IXOSC|nr:hypothetical protein IscW_ISCW004971 [Ixodes scapularis]|eukprot:XP_002433706.1 hypothetical protein IscW_ISCW004971 [Ixodes scapularis]
MCNIRKNFSHTSQKRTHKACLQGVVFDVARLRSASARRPPRGKLPKTTYPRLGRLSSASASRGLPDTP